MIKQQQQVFLEENMSNLTSAASGDASVSSGNTTNRAEPSNSIYLQQQQPQQQQHYFPQQQQQQQQSSDDQPPPAKKKRNLPGNPDPEAEVIALSPKSLLATNRFVCEICNKGFQRDQNLQLHRRGHNLPWKLKQRTNKEVKKKVYVCPEPSCVHHDPSRALGDLTGIKKHFCRKHGEKKHKCEKCSKRYAVQSDWKAHSKVCGTREYRCDCGTLFSRRDSFITHRAFCDALAEETARAITTPTPTTTNNNNNPLLSNPIAAAVAAAAAGGGPSSTSHFMNLQQQHQQQVHNQLMSSSSNNHDPLHAFPLKREQQSMINLPPWLSCPPIDHHHHHQNQLQSPTSSSSIMFHHNNTQDQMFQQQNQHHQQQQQQNPNPISNPSMGPTFSGGLGGPYHTQAATSPHMSATALLQKAAQMGATMSNTATHPQPHHHLQQQHQQSHVTDTNTTPTTSTAGLFGLNLSSRDHQDITPPTPTPTTHTSGQFINQGFLSSFGNNKAATPSPTTNAAAAAAATTTIGGSGSGSGSGTETHLTGLGPNQQGPPAPAASSYFHDMMVNSLSSTYDHHDDDAFGLPTMGMLNTTKKHPNFHQPNNGRNDNGGGNDGLTRDFLGLRPLSHSDILTIAGFGNCMTSNNPSHHHHHQQQQDTHHKSWQG